MSPIAKLVYCDLILYNIYVALVRHERTWPHLILYSVRSVILETAQGV